MASPDERLTAKRSPSPAPSKNASPDSKPRFSPPPHHDGTTASHRPTKARPKIRVCPENGVID